VSATDWDRLGGEPVVRGIVHAFMRKVYADPMIGFFFEKAPRDRLEALEVELVSEVLGGPYTYTGRSMAEAHGRHPIMGGHFARRRKILEETLLAYDVPGETRAKWLGHVDRLRAEVLAPGRAGEACDDTKEAKV
jgi:hemoglobin